MLETARFGGPFLLVLSAPNDIMVGMNGIAITGRGGVVKGYAPVDDDVYASYGHMRWHLNNQGYVAHTTPTNEQGKQDTLLLHRLVMGLGKGERAKVDHIDHDKLNNQRSNLRIVTHAQNHQNRTANGNRNTSSRYRGVSYKKATGRWAAYAKLNGKIHHIGYYDTEEEAGAAAAEWRRVNMPFSAEALAA